jgi:hypothetical protein
VQFAALIKEGSKSIKRLKPNRLNESETPSAL